MKLNKKFLRVVYRVLVIVIGLVVIIVFNYFNCKNNNVCFSCRVCLCFFFFIGVILEKIGVFDMDVKFIVLNY